MQATSSGLSKSEQALKLMILKDIEMAVKVKTSGKNKDNFDIVFEFKNAEFFVTVDPDMYNDIDLAEIEYIVNHMSKDIWIDKSYVDFPENKHKDVFLGLDGWENVCKLVRRTKYGKLSPKLADGILFEAFQLMMTAYMYDILEKFDYDISGINLDVLNKGIETYFYKDGIQEWKHYPGPWQDWGLEDSEQ